MTDREKIITRERILNAARIVFAEKPYNSASMRKIGQAGGFDHPLISYYFPTKADLFESVIREICEEIITANTRWYDEIMELPISEALPVYLDNLMMFNRSHPFHFRIVALNMAQASRISDIPGHDIITSFLNQCDENFMNRFNMHTGREEVKMFISAFNILVLNYLGSEKVYSELSYFSSMGIDYDLWVKKSLLILFEPRLRLMLKNREAELSASGR